MKEQTIFITGATGTVGSHLIRGLLEKGYSRIIAFVRSDSDRSLLSGIEHLISFAEGDLLDIFSIREALPEESIVVHAAAKVSYHPKDERELMAVNVEGTANLVNLCLEKKVQRLVFLSSVAAIGRPVTAKMITEDLDWTDSKFNTPYGISKHLSELEVWRGMAEGLDVNVLNPSMILGPGIWGSSSTKLFMHVFKGSKVYPVGSNDFVDVRDVVKLTILLMESTKINERYIAAGAHCTYKELFQKIAAECNCRPPRIKMSPFIARTIAYFAQVAGYITGKEPIITSETVKISSGNFEYNAGKSIKAFDFNYYPLDQSISDTVAVYNVNKGSGSTYGYFEKIYE